MGGSCIPAAIIVVMITIGASVEPALVALIVEHTKATAQPAQESMIAEPAPKAVATLAPTAVTAVVVAVERQQ
jgi:hypothetical protein